MVVVVCVEEGRAQLVCVCVRERGGVRERGRVVCVWGGEGRGGCHWAVLLTHHRHTKPCAEQPPPSPPPPPSSLCPPHKHGLPVATPPPRLPASPPAAQVARGGLVLDPFVGTGSTLVPAAHLGALTLGADIDFRVIKIGGCGGVL